MEKRKPFVCQCMHGTIIQVVPVNYCLYCEKIIFEKFTSAVIWKWSCHMTNITNKANSTVGVPYMYIVVVSATRSLHVYRCYDWHKFLTCIYIVVSATSSLHVYRCHECHKFLTCIIVLSWLPPAFSFLKISVTVFCTTVSMSNSICATHVHWEFKTIFTRNVKHHMSWMRSWNSTHCAQVLICVPIEISITASITSVKHQK